MATATAIFTTNTKLLLFFLFRVLLKIMLTACSHASVNYLDFEESCFMRFLSVAHYANVTNVTGNIFFVDLDMILMKDIFEIFTQNNWYIMHVLFFSTELT